jgi:hypothetical protein
MTAVTGQPPRNYDFKTRVIGGSRSPHSYSRFGQSGTAHSDEPYTDTLMSMPSEPQSFANEYGNRLYCPTLVDGTSQLKSTQRFSTPGKSCRSFMASLFCDRNSEDSSICAGTRPPSDLLIVRLKVAMPSADCPRSRCFLDAIDSANGNGTPSIDRPSCSYGPEIRNTAGISPT